LNVARNLAQADPTRVAGWRSMMTHAVKEVQQLVHARANYDRFAALVRANDHVLNGESDLPNHVQRWFIHFATMSVRRIVEPNSPTGDIRSLRVVLDDMHRAARAFTSASVAELFEAPDAPQYDPELRAFLIASMWENVAATSGHHEQLNAKMLKDDRKMLALVSDRITDIVDKVIAHRTTSQQDHALSYPELSTCIDVSEAIALRYHATLLGPSMSTLVPVDQFNWYDIFRRDWLY
jgi:hypothetical protein